MDRTFLALTLLSTAAATACAAPVDIIHPGTTAWVAAAQTGRADMLILGDSVVNTQGNGWDAGFIAALSSTVGLAGSGLLTGIGGEGHGYNAAPPFSGSPWSADLSLVPPDKRGYVWREKAFTVGGTPTSSFAAIMDGSTLSSTTGIDLLLYTASANGAGTAAARQRLGMSPWTVKQTLPAVSTAAPSGPGLNQVVFHFDSPTSLADQSREMIVENATDTTIFYARLLAPGAPGATVTSWGDGGKSTLSFLQEQWLNPNMTAEGKKAWFDALVDGASGKLNVAINQGFNDRNDPRPSHNNVALSNTAAGHADNLSALIAAVRADWVAAGRELSDLSFTLFSDYKDYYDTISSEKLLAQFAQQEALIAAGDPQISYVDVYGRSPSYDELDAMGYMFDRIHASKAGTDFFAAQVVAALIPEPSAASLLALSILTLARRQRRTLFNLNARSLQ